jgi:hypothetical protein
MQMDIKRLGLGLVAAWVFSVVAVSSAFASPLFLSHPSALLLATAKSLQLFVTPSHQFECTALKLLPPGDTTVALRALSLLLVVEYEGCKIGSLAVLSAHPVRYLVDANGSVSMENNFLILGGNGCLIQYLASKNQSLGTMKFANLPNSSMLLSANVKLMTSEGVGGKLGICEFSEIGNGTYTGDISLTLDSNPFGTLRWDP